MKLATLTSLHERRSRLGDLVLAHGCFDVIHVGYVRHLQQARWLGSTLVVTVTPDRFVNKGNGRPLFPEDVRVEVVAALECVDYAALNLWPTAVETILALRPKIYVKGSQFRGRMTPMLVEEAAAVKSVGGELRFTDEIQHSSKAVIEGRRFVRPGEAYAEVTRCE